MFGQDKRANGQIYHTYPSLKSAEDQKALWAGAATGAIHCIATETARSLTLCDSRTRECAFRSFAVRFAPSDIVALDAWELIFWAWQQWNNYCLSGLPHCSRMPDFFEETLRCPKSLPVQTATAHRSSIPRFQTTRNASCVA